MPKKIDFKNSELLSSVILILVGLLLAIFRDSVLQWAMTAAGVVFVVFGVIDVVRKNWINGAISIIIGAAIIVLGWTLASIVLIVLGVLLAIKSIISLYEIVKFKNKNVMELVYAICGIFLGILLAFGNLLSVLILIAGILLIVDGAIGIYGELTKK
jgi:hypothetical protein